MSKEIVWFVRDGKMQNGWVISSLTFQFTGDAQKSPLDIITDEDRELQNLSIMLFDAESRGRIPQPIMNMYNRPGMWYLISGYRLVYCGDVFNTREEAAKNAYQLLLDDSEVNDHDTA